MVHRFVKKFCRYIREATEQLQDYQERNGCDMSGATSSKYASGKSNVVCLLLSSSDSDSATEDEGEEEDESEEEDEGEEEDEDA